MGQEISQHALFVEQLGQALKARGVKVKVKQLCKYFDYVKELCPWFPLEGTIDPKRWQRVGDAMKDFYNTFGPEKVPVTAFSYWNLINELLSFRQTDPVVANVVRQGQAILQEVSSLASQNDLKGLPEDLMSLDSEEEDLNPLPPPRKKRTDKPEGVQHAPNTDSQLYPSLPGVLAQNKEEEKTEKAEKSTDMGDINWQDLAEQAAKYNQERYKPPPYATAPTAFPVIDPQKELRDKIEYLKDQIKLEKEHQELITQLERLKTGKPSVATNPSPTPSLGTGKQKPLIPPTGPLLDAYPVTETTDAHTQQAWRHHRGFDFVIVKELKTAVAQYGATAPYTMAILESIAENWLTPSDWQTLTRATLAGGDYLLWKSEYAEACHDTAKRNLQAGNGWTLDMLLGEGNFVTQDNQMQFEPGLFAQIQSAGTRAWRKLPAKGDMSASLTNIKQGPDEPFADFVHRLITAAGRIFGSADAGMEFVQQLAFENANAACQAAIRPYKKKTDLNGYIRLCADIGAAYQQGLAMAAALQGFTVKQFLAQQGKNKCFNCGEVGHFAKNCQGKTSNTKRPPGLCPRCKRGPHWANECKSKKDVQGNPLPPNQGNGRRGQPQAPGPKHIYGAMAANSTSSINPFHNSAEPPQGAQDWTSVPPPTQY